TSVKNCFNRITGFYPKSKDFLNRIESVMIELKDIISEIEVLSTDIEHDPERIKFITERLNLIYSLQQKYNVTSISELLTIQQDLDRKLQTIQSFDRDIIELENTLSRELESVKKLSEEISSQRKSFVTELEKNVIYILQQLGIPNAKFSIVIECLTEPGSTGIDQLKFLFSANKNLEAEEISKIASGGELSRLMLSMKYIIARSSQMPTIIFDEIDSGVSGEIAEKMALIMKGMSNYMQVISITHLPQIASKGDFHYKVYKTEGNKDTSTHIELLSSDERVNEVAKMLSGQSLTEAAIEHAKNLLAS
ncbi:MAG: DNA repair protein RecN, partial [Bacteroidota bacterium]